MQCGAVIGKGTDVATHLVRSAIAAGKLLSLSVFVLFVDLTKAFDKVIRQIVFGWGTAEPDDRVQYLMSLGVTRTSAEWVEAYIRERGHVFAQWEVDSGAAGLAQSLHEGAWFAVADLDTAVITKTGGRQGCKLGGTTFNSVYGVALDMLAWELKKAGIVFRVKVAVGPFWQAPENSSYGEDADVVDATFVDDECIVLLACRADLLDKAIDALLVILFRVFSLMHLEINLLPGKTECLLTYRGHGAVKHREQWRCADGKLRITSPSLPGKAIDVVGVYKHLGTMCGPAGDTFKNTLHRSQAAMSAYSPISAKVFGNALIEIRHRLSFVSTLIVTKLLFAVHVTVPSSRDILTYNA
eukprot:383944-Karenia_brevis.AAC.1